jgi:hypothetical protein
MISYKHLPVARRTRIANVWSYFCQRVANNLLQYVQHSCISQNSLAILERELAELFFTSGLPHKQPRDTVVPLLILAI